MDARSIDNYFGALAPLMEDGDVEEIWINSPSRIFAARKGISELTNINMTGDEVKNLIEKNAFVKPTRKEWDKETEARTLASLIALRKAMTEYPIHHAVTFHSSIKKAEAFPLALYVPPALKKSMYPSLLKSPPVTA
mgnify:CR=1 FL=1